MEIILSRLMQLHRTLSHLKPGHCSFNVPTAQCDMVIYYLAKSFIVVWPLVTRSGSGAVQYVKLRR